MVFLMRRFTWSNHQPGWVCPEGLQVEEVTLRSETVSESLVWAHCISDSGVWYLSSSERPLYVLADTTWEKDPTSYVCGWYCDHRDDTRGIGSLKKNLQKHFQANDLGSLKYLGIEMARYKNGILLSLRKYELDLLSEVGMLKCRSIDSPIDVNMKMLLY